MAQLYIPDLARPDFHRWGRVQRGLETINRFPFRLALEALQRETGKNYYANDPLSRLAEPAAWRRFLLSHWDFDELGDAVPEGAPDPFGDERRARKEAGDPAPTLECVRKHIQKEYRAYDYDPQKTNPDDRAEAANYCRKNLDLFVQAWIALNEMIDYCNRSDVGFARLTDKKPYGESVERWEALKREGHLVTNLPKGVKPPRDTLALERYSIHTRYVLVTVKEPEPAE